MKASDEIYFSFRAWVAENTPPGARLDMNTNGLHRIEVCCDGRVSLTAYLCCYDPGHEGACYSRGKRVDFEPEEGGPNRMNLAFRDHVLQELEKWSFKPEIIGVPDTTEPTRIELLSGS